MIFLDANYFLRYIVQATTPESLALTHVAKELFDAVARGEEEVTTSEVVLHEVIYVLASKRQYNLQPADIAALLRPILELPGLRLPRGQRKLLLRALDLFVTYPRLGYADALIDAHCERQGIPLATFDRDFDRVAEIERWRPRPGLPEDVDRSRR